MPGAFPFPTRPNPDDEYDTAHQKQEATQYQFPTENDGAYNLTSLPSVDEQFVNRPFSEAEEQESAEQDGQETLVSPEALLPPEAQGETNGGPLGCCLGMTVGIMLSLLLGLIGVGHLIMIPLLSIIHTDAITNIRIATGIFGFIGAVLGGYFGWKIGKRVYREYDSPVIKDSRRSSVGAGLSQPKRRQFKEKNI